MENLSGTTIKGYKLEERIGSGGFGAVYRAVQTTINREVAIKIILPGFANQPDFIRRFEAEARLIAHLEHLHIVPLYDYWRDPTGAYLVMRYMRGGSLKDTLHQNGAFDPIAVLRLLGQIASALAVAHRNKIIHRDLKPGNILMDEDGNAYLGDFGIAKDLTAHQEDITEADKIIGSPGYLSPEQARSEPVTPRTDIYSLGVVLFEVLAGEHPFPNMSDVERLFKHMNDSLPHIASLNGDIVEAVNAVIQKATARNPEHRYADVLEMGMAYQEAIAPLQKDAGEKIVEMLTRREQDILLGIVDGLSNREIADKFFITVATVKWYIRQIYSKLGVRSRIQAIVRARELNLIVGDATAATQKTGAEDEVATLMVDAAGLPTSIIALPEPENPYKGLRAFQSVDVDDFFGREKITQKLTRQLEDNRFLAVVGPSGSGKSSLVRAGLIPAVWRGSIPGSERWFTVEMLPKLTVPLDELEIALMRVAADQAGNIGDQLRRDESGLLRAAQLILPDDGSQLLLVIDQFEEVFTLLENEDIRTQFLDLLVAAATDKRSRVRIVVTLRADFYDRPLHYANMGELIRTHMETVLPLSAEELEQAITRPAARVGVNFEEGLVSDIVGDVLYQPGALPLLQYALTELFERREGRTLTRNAYQEIGGTVGALAKRAEDLFASLNATGQEAARQMFLRLVTLGEGVEDTRRRVRRSELLAISPDRDLMDEIIDSYTEYRLLALDNDPATRSPTVELAHEAIIREWERLREWLLENRDDIRLERLLSHATDEWLNADKDASFLLHGARLAQFEEWAKDTDLSLTDDERAFLQNSIKERERQESEEQQRQQRELETGRELAAKQTQAASRLRYLVGVFVLATIVSGILAFAAFNQSQIAQDEADNRAAAEAVALQERDNAEREAETNRSLILADNALEANERGDRDIALAIGLEAVAMDNPPLQAQSALFDIAYSPGTRHVLTDHDPESWLFSAAISPDSRLGASGGGILFWDDSVDGMAGEDTAIRLWNLESGELIRRFEGHRMPLKSLAFSPDGQTLLSSAAIVAWDNEIIWEVFTDDVILWNVETGEEIRRYDVNGAGIFRVLFTPDGQKFVAAGGIAGEVQGFLKIYDVESGEIIREFTDLPLTISGIALSPDGQLLASTDNLGNTVLWNMETGEQLDTISSPDTTAIVDVTFSPDGGLITLATQSSLYLMDRESKNIVHQEQLAMSPGTLHYTADGQYLAYHAGANFVVFDTYDWENPYPLEPTHINLDVFNHPRMAISPDGRFVMAVAEDSTVRVWNLVTEDIAHRFPTVGMPLPSLAINTEGDYLLTGTRSGEVQLWNIATQEVETQFQAANLAVQTVAFSPDSRYALVAAGSMFMEGTPHSLSLWDIENQQMVCEFYGFNGVPEAAFSPDGQTIVSASINYLLSYEYFGDLVLWDTENCREIRHFDTVLDFSMIVFTPDGQQVVTAGYSSQALQLWDVATGNLVREYIGHHGEVTTLALHPNGQMMLSGATDGTLILWNLETGEIIHHFYGHDAEISSVAISPDGRYALSGDNTGLMILWDIAAGVEVRRFQEHADGITEIVFSSDGQSAFTTSRDGALIRWDISVPGLDELLAWIENNRYIREFTPEEEERWLSIASTDNEDSSSLNLESVTPEMASVSLTATPSVTPQPVRVAQLGEQQGELLPFGSDIWLYEGQAGEVLNIIMLSVNDFDGSGWYTVREIHDSMFVDTYLIIRHPDGSILIENNDIFESGDANAYIYNLVLPETGTYTIEARSLGNLTQGPYTLILERGEETAP